MSFDYKLYLLEKYEESYYPDNVLNSGKLVYIKRNFEMIDKSKFCIIYYDKNYIPSCHRKRNNLDYPSKSGTKIAYEYATKKQRIIINLFNEID